MNSVSSKTLDPDVNDSKETGLDRLIWGALTTLQAPLSFGDNLARRYHPEVSTFAAVVSDTPQAYEALCRIVLPDERVLLQSREPIQPVPGLTLTSVGLVHQMILTRQGLDYSGGDEIVHLGKRDALDMLELATKTKPGPFFARTHETGHYIGVRHQGRLVAMAGERMRIDGYVEISAVCVDEAWRGKGLARRLIAVLSRRIQQTGLIPFLHVFSHNSSALALYERLGFVSRGTFHITMASNHVSHPGHTITDQIDR